jgi:protein-disulfide isomerase
MMEDTEDVTEHPVHHRRRKLLGISTGGWAGIVLGVAIVAIVGYTANKVIKKIDSIGATVADQGSQIKQVSNSVAAITAAQQPAPTPDPNKVYTLTIAPNTPFLGSTSAPVTVVEYADYHCPFCEQFYTGAFPDIKAKYIDTGKVKFYYQDFPFLAPDSTTAAEATQCANDQGDFWQYHDYLFNHQGGESSGDFAAVDQKKFAKALGLNVVTFASCLDSGKYADFVTQEKSNGTNVGVQSTPTVFINGKMILGALPAATFDAAIDKALGQ